MNFAPCQQDWPIGGCSSAGCVLKWRVASRLPAPMRTLGRLVSGALHPFLYFIKK